MIFMLQIFDKIKMELIYSLYYKSIFVHAILMIYILS